MIQIIGTHNGEAIKYREMKFNKSWKVVHVKANHEFKVANELSTICETYCPQMEVIKNWSDRKKKLSQPLFKNYVFVKPNDATEEQICLEHQSVNYFLTNNRIKSIVRAEEIERIKFLYDKKMPKSANTNIFSNGDRFVITKDIFTDQDISCLLYTSPSPRD